MRSAITFFTFAAAALACTSDGKGQVEVSPAATQWRTVTLTLDGPCASESNDPNPFLDHRMTVAFVHESGKPAYDVPGYFAADGNAANTLARQGTKWRAHLLPDKPGRWTWRISFVRGGNVAVLGGGEPAKAFEKQGSFRVAASKDEGRLQYNGSRYLHFAGSGRPFIKTGTDSPETLLAYSDFDRVETRKAPLKTYGPHVQDWRAGDPVWQKDKGKGLIGAINYLASQGVNAMSFLTYNAGGDGDNVWPFVARDDKFRYNCARLDQWNIVFDHAQRRGLFLHFKLQETENDDQRLGPERKTGNIPTALDGGALGRERKLYLREMIARFAHHRMLNWNLGEENTQSTEEQQQMAQFLDDMDPYDHHRVLHTYPQEQERVYKPLLGNGSALTGLSLQNAYDAVHRLTLHWIEASAKAGKQWVIANDEQGTADLGVPPDVGYKEFNGRGKDGKPIRTTHDIRKQTLWGHLMAGGAGVEYYFGYTLPENDLNLEDFRSRDTSWRYARIAREFFEKLPVAKMASADALVSNGAWCFAQAGQTYVVYLPNGGTTDIDLSAASGSLRARWLNPRTGESHSAAPLKTGARVSVGPPPSEPDQDWAVIIESTSRR